MNQFFAANASRVRDTGIGSNLPPRWHLRIASLLVGLAVGVLSLIGLWRKLRGRRGLEQ